MSKSYSCTYHIRTYERGADGNVPLHQIGNYMQDIAGKHATELGWSIDALQKGGQSWVLSRMKISLARTVTHADSNLTLRTWPCGADRMYAFRAFDIRDDEGGSVGAAITYWVLLDMAKRRPLPMPQEIYDLAESYPESPVKLPLPKLSLPEDNSDEIPFRVNPSDLDVNHHVNNTVYIRWMEDARRLRTQQKYMPSDLDILYKAEVSEGTNVTVMTDDSGRKSVVKDENGKVVCLAEIKQQF